LLWGRHFEAASVPGEASRQACHAGGRAGRGTQSRAARGLPNANRRQTPDRRQDWRRGPQDCVLHRTARSTSSRRPVEHAAGLACRRARRQRNTTPSGAGLPNANRRQDWRRGPQDCALHLKLPPESGACRQACHAGGASERAGRLAAWPGTQCRPSGAGLQLYLARHPPPRLAAWPAGLRAPPQAAAAPLRIYNWVRTKRRRDRRGERGIYCPGGEIGRRKGLKILWGATLVRVQVPPRAPEPAAATPQRKTASRLRRGLEWLTKSPRPFELGSAGS
jgi:hypothetical protein